MTVPDATAAAVLPCSDAEASTRERILSVATDLFAAQGYRGATVRAICAKAGVNVASVNYYFRSKHVLYEEVFAAEFNHVARPMIERSAEVRDAASWEAVLREWMLFMLRLFLGESPQEVRIRRLVAHERASPSSACGLLFERFFRPVTDGLERLLRMALPPDADEDEVRVWLVATTSQCTVFLHRDPPWDDFLLGAHADRDALIERIADHVVASISARLQFHSTGVQP